MKFKLISSYRPTGDQPRAIKSLSQGIDRGYPYQTLLGVTGSGKTYTMAQVIQNCQKPTLVISHNKTLAAQLYQEFRDYFPQNAVSYFVSYYDYYQPEAYLPSTDTYIEKETDINEEIDKLRLSATTNLLTRPDCIVVASVSCIYNLGSPIEYGRYILPLTSGQHLKRQALLTQLTNLQYSRSEFDLIRGTFIIKGDTITLWPAYEDRALKISTLEDRLEKFTWVDPISLRPLPNQKPDQPVIYPAKHYVANPQIQAKAFSQIHSDLKIRLAKLKQAGKIVEAYRLEQKVNFDLENISEFGFVNGIENYSRYFDGRKVGDPPYTLLDYFAHNAQTYHQSSFLTVIDESHMTIPQLRGMHAGDQSRKQTLIDYGFRLPSALDNRPLTLSETLRRLPQVIFTSATPGDWELEQSQGQVAQQLIRPTGLLDPKIFIRSTQDQIDDLISEIIKTVQSDQRVLVTTLTKKMAEALTDYLNDPGKIQTLIDSSQILDKSSKIRFPKVAYLHSDIDTLDRSDILDCLRGGEYDVLVGINLLREGLDLPEVSLVAILDADKEGFLRSKTSLVQTMGRAARHQTGRVIMYADKITPSMAFAISETKRRRQIQSKYNLTHHLEPVTITKPIRQKLINRDLTQESQHQSDKLSDLIANQADLTPADLAKTLKTLEKELKVAAKAWDFEKAAKIRDTINALKHPV